MENTTIQSSEGEVKVAMTAENKGKISFEALGIKAGQIKIDGGFMRLVFDFDQFNADHFYAIPTLEVVYDKNVAETHWQCDFNGEMILDKTDNHGKSTVILLNRSKMVDLIHHHNNTLVVHGEFPENVKVDLERSLVNFIK
jgi:hypothetical protein